jgi:hypothetical protein
MGRGLRYRCSARRHTKSVRPGVSVGSFGGFRSSGGERGGVDRRVSEGATYAPLKLDGDQLT